METYGLAVHCFARALVQLSAQQRGLNYFREHQPWRSMQPLEAGAALALLDDAGWRTEKGAPASAVAGVPDLARILRDTSPPSSEPPVASAPALERLIPGSVATPFFPHELVGSNSSGGLVQTLNASPPGPVDAAVGWPRIVWPAWPLGVDGPWSFGQITTSPSALKKAEVIEVNPATRMILIPAH
jgi:hypothetical protein